jgi:tRNA uridine 5-carboxymethylaminomethyl modification enzyme
MARAREAAAGPTLTPDRETLAWLPFEIGAPTTPAKLMQRPDFDLATFRLAAGATLPELEAAFAVMTEEEQEAVTTHFRYAGYITRQQKEAERLLGDDEVRIPASMTYALPGLSREVVEKLSAVRPASLGQASRIPGVTPAAIAIVRMHVRRGVRVAE